MEHDNCILSMVQPKDSRIRFGFGDHPWVTLLGCTSPWGRGKNFPGATNNLANANISNTFPLQHICQNTSESGRILNQCWEELWWVRESYVLQGKKPRIGTVGQSKSSVYSVGGNWKILGTKCQRALFVCCTSSGTHLELSIHLDRHPLEKTQSVTYYRFLQAFVFKHWTLWEQRTSFFLCGTVVCRIMVHDNVHTGYGLPSGTP